MAAVGVNPEVYPVAFGIKPLITAKIRHTRYTASKYLDRNNTIRCYRVEVIMDNLAIYLWFPVEAGALPHCTPMVSGEIADLVNMHAKYIREQLDFNPRKDSTVVGVSRSIDSYPLPTTKVLNYDPLREAISISAGQYYIPYEVWVRWE